MLLGTINAISMIDEIKTLPIHYNISLMVAFIFLLVLTVPANQETVIAYHNEQLDGTRQSTFGVQIDYPSAWSVTEDVENEMMTITSNQHDFQDTILETFSITRFPAHGGTAVDLARFLTTEFYPQNLIDFTVITERPGTISGRDSYIFVYKYRDNDLGQLQAMDIIISAGDQLYDLTYTAEDDKYNSYLNIITQIVDSFTIIEDPTGEIGKGDPTGEIGK